MLPPMPAAHLDQLPDICPHDGYDPAQCHLCVDATRDREEMRSWKARVAQDPAYRKAQAEGAFTVPDEQIIWDRAFQIATEKAKTLVFESRQAWCAYITETANRLVAEFRAKGEAVLWR